MNGKRITKIRKTLNLSQLNFAKQLKTTNVTINRYEKGVMNPSSDFYEKLVTVFNVNVNYLLTGTGEMFIGTSGVTASDEAESAGQSDKDKRIRELEQELSTVKKSIHALEKEYKELGHQNTELSRELIAKMQKLLNLQDRLIPQ